ncbi:proline-rich extensin-like protein EPR1 [Anguilla anguilla]|uniref:proline-rich extensin-like protein EPR1 n=1 Tax=Anguilla anguilla TaxID=7936 RepID=UPI0015A7833A|nr:proline-rich extensin-like protein EPR1 [Anguilla anguilla]
MAKRWSFVGFAMFVWFGYFCDAVEDAATPTSVDRPSVEIPVINDTAMGLQSDSPVIPAIVTGPPPFFNPAFPPAQGDFFIERPPTTLAPVGQPSYQRPAATMVPVGQPPYQRPAATMVPVGQPFYQRPAATMVPVGQPSFETLVPPRIPVGQPFYQRPAATMVPVGQPSFETLVPPRIPVGQPPYQRPAATMLPVGQPFYQRPAATMLPVGQPPYQRPAATLPPVGQPPYQRPAATLPPVGQPPYQRPAATLPPVGQPPYQRPAATLPPVGQPPYQRPAATLPPVGQPPYQRPAATLPPVGQPPYQRPAATLPPVGQPPYQRPAATLPPVGQPPYQRPAATLPPVGQPPYQRPAATLPPVGQPPYQRPAATLPPVGQPPYQRPAATLPPVGQPPYQRPAATLPPVGQPPYQRPAATLPPVGQPPYQRPAATLPPVGQPPYQRPAATLAPVGQPSYQRPVATLAPVGQPSYQRPVATLAPVGKPSLDPVLPVLPVPDIVRAICGESLLQVEVNAILLGIGQLVHPSEITLGGCGPVEQDKSDWQLHFVTELHGCGSTQMMTEDSLIYTFSLNYQPKALVGTPIVRSSEAVVLIQCHYPRLHNVSSNALHPTWIPYQSTMSAEELLVFTLRLMEDDWQQERASRTFFLGDTLKIEASVVQANHVPLRVFIERCVAYLDPSLAPSYAFVKEDGCLMDSQLPGSHSMFLPRLQDDKLRMEVDAFRFAQEDRSSIYFYCHLKATAASDPYGGKACSFSPEAGRWLSLSGMDVCSCCEASSCVARKGRSLDESAAQWEGDALLGPVTIQQAAATDLVSESRSSLLKAEDHKATGASPVAIVVAGVTVTVGILCMIVLATVLRWRRRKSLLYEESG